MPTSDTMPARNCGSSGVWIGTRCREPAWIRRRCSTKSNTAGRRPELRPRRGLLVAMMKVRFATVIAAVAAQSVAGQVASPQINRHAPLPAEPLTFEQRCADPGVVLCDPLDDGRVRGVSIDGRTVNGTLPQA